MKEEDIVNDDEMESQTLSNGKKSSRKPSGDDPISDWLLRSYYLLRSDSMKGVKLGLMVSPFILILCFSLFVSNNTSNLIAFTSLVISMVFIAISMWMLCWILDKDAGTRAM